jgi:tetratricopeptide (TPR) repeat protein
VNVLNAVAVNNLDAPQGDAAYAIEKLTLATNIKNFNNPATYVLMGDAYRRQIDGGNAVQAYTKALTMDNKLAEAEYQIGKIYLTQNNKDYFLPAFEKAVEMDPAYAPAWFEIFYYYYYHWDKDKATNALNNYVANADPGPDVDLIKVDFKVATGDFNGAKADAQALIAKMGDKAPARFYRTIAYCCDTLGDNNCAMTNIGSYFSKVDMVNVIPLDYVLKANIEGKSSDTLVQVKAFDDFGLAIQKDSLPEDKAKFLGQAQALATKLNNKGALAKIATIVYTSIKVPTNSDTYKFGMAFYQAGDYKTADSIFCQVYQTKFPDEVFGYLYCMRSKALEDDSIGSQGIAEMKLADWGRAKDSIAKATGTKDSIAYKKYVIDCYSRLAFYYNNTKKDKQQAIFWLQKILEVDPGNADAQKYITALQKPPRPAAPGAKPKAGGK